MSIDWPRNPIFHSLSSEERRRLRSRCQHRKLEAGEPILTEHDPGDHVFLLEAGAARVFHMSPSGLELIVMFCRAPSLFGELEMMLEIPHIEHVAAVEPSAVDLIPKDVLRELLLERPEVSFALLRDVCAKLAMASHNQKALASQSVATRLSTFLVGYAQFQGRRTVAGVELPQGLTQDRMAEALGVTRRAIAQEIARWQKQGALSRAGGRYLIRDLAQLSKLAEAEHIGLTYDTETGLTILPKGPFE